MSDSNVQQQWLNAAAKLRETSATQEAAAAELRAKSASLQAENQVVLQQIRDLRNRLLAGVAGGGFVLQSQRDNAEKQIQALESQFDANIKTYQQWDTQASDYRTESLKNLIASDDAEKKAQTATEGPPNTQTVTAPIENAPIEVNLNATQTGVVIDQQGKIVTPTPNEIRTAESTQIQTFDDGSTLDPSQSGEAGFTVATEPKPVDEPGAGFSAGSLDSGVGPGDDLSAATAAGSARGLQAQQRATQAQATLQDVVNFNNQKDWRLRLSLAPNAKYLYNAPNPGILGPLATTRGVLFPYTPQISLSYSASYDSTSLAHTNFVYYNYKHSSVGGLNIIADFTAQDTFEANYLLAVMHFFRSATKMFYGKDNNPKLGTPPPLCYLNGFGPYQFNNHAVVISEYSYTLPKDVDYIRAGNANYPAGVTQDVTPKNRNPVKSDKRLTNGTSNIKPGGGVPLPKWITANGGTVDPTYVPTKISLNITCLPIVTRADIVNNFSLEKYATGQLLLGSTRKGGGIW